MDAYACWHAKVSHASNSQRIGAAKKSWKNKQISGNLSLLYVYILTCAI